MVEGRWAWLGAAMLLWLIGAASIAMVARDTAPSSSAIADAPASQSTRTYGLASAGLSFPFAAAVAKGFADEARRAGVRAVVLDAKGGLQKQANDIDDLSQRKVDGVAIMPLDSVAATGWVDRLSAGHVPVVAVAALVGDPRKRETRDVYPGLTALAAQDEVEAGRMAGRMAATLLPAGTTSEIAIIEGAAGFPEVEQRARGFALGLREAGANWRLVASQPGGWTAEGGEAACQNLIAAHPRIALFFNEADDMVIGCARAVRAAGSQARLIGVGGSRLALAQLRAGAIDGTVCFQPEALGALALDSLVHPPQPAQRFRSYPIMAVTRADAARCTGQW